MALGDRNLQVGTRLVARYKKVEYHCEVVAGEEGKVKYRLMDSNPESGNRRAGEWEDFKTPAGAGQAVRGGKATNGWAFWSVEGAAPTTGKDGHKTARGHDESGKEEKATPEASGPHPAPKPERTSKGERRPVNSGRRST